MIIDHLEPTVILISTFSSPPTSSAKYLFLFFSSSILLRRDSSNFIKMLIYFALVAVFDILYQIDLVEDNGIGQGISPQHC